MEVRAVQQRSGTAAGRLPHVGRCKLQRPGCHWHACLALHPTPACLTPPPLLSSPVQDPYGTLFVSIPSLLDPSLCPEGTHTFHAFT